MNALARLVSSYAAQNAAKNAKLDDDLLAFELSPCVLVQPDGWARGEREGYGVPGDVTSLSLSLEHLSTTRRSARRAVDKIKLRKNTTIYKLELVTQAPARYGTIANHLSPGQPVGETSSRRFRSRTCIMFHMD